MFVTYLEEKTFSRLLFLIYFKKPKLLFILRFS